MLTVRDLLTHYPRRLDDRGALTDIAHLRVDEHATVLARVKTVTESTYRPKYGGHGKRLAKRTEVVITDGRVDLTATFFNQPWRAGSLTPGVVAFFSGKVATFRGQRQLAQTTYDVLGRGSDVSAYDDEETQRYWPIYPASASVSSKRLAGCVELALAVLDPVPDHLPDDVRREHGLIGYDEALRLVHQPTGPADFRRARDRLRFDEAFVLQVVLAQRRSLARSLSAEPRPRRLGGLAEKFDHRLPFELTSGPAGERRRHRGRPGS